MDWSQAGIRRKPAQDAPIDVEKPDVHVPLLPFGVATRRPSGEAQVRSNFRSRSADVSHLPAGSIKPCELTLPYCSTRTVKRLYGEARRMQER
ncbi:MAG: hypothetical protein AUG08_09985 [Acidobacteria bacterium 13_1_20CM_2_55_15]|nr:MAG: hypothetical protein AUG08_09985 [Acidobacteria bacterium 13_1_20CM_2_55_15]